MLPKTVLDERRAFEQARKGLQERRAADQRGRSASAVAASRTVQSICRPFA